MPICRIDDAATLDGFNSPANDGDSYGLDLSAGFF
jgi:hypothetical protein